MDRQTAAREILLLGALEELQAAAASAEIELVPLKGAALLELGIYSPGERGMTDIDVLVRPEQLGDLEKALAGLGYVPMPHSSDAWVRASEGEAPPAIVDVHTRLWHVPDTEGLFKWGLESGPAGLALGLADLFLHAAVHPLLHHGELTQKALEDCGRIAEAAPGDGAAFWSACARKAVLYGLRPALWPALRRLRLPPGVALEAFRPRGAERIKAAFFEMAARKRSTLLEYILPALQRPGLVRDYALPDRRFMERRYGSSGVRSYLLRPLRLLGAAFSRDKSL